MPLPTTYDEAALTEYMTVVLGPTATALGWSADGPELAEAVNDTVAAYGVSDIADATDRTKLRAIAAWQAWRWAADALASRYNLSTDGQSLSRSQMFEQACKARDAAFQACAPHLSVYAVTAVPIIHIDDPIDAAIRYAALRESGG